MNYLNELSLVFLGSATSLLISAVLKESVAMRYSIGVTLLISSFIAFTKA